LLILVLIVVFGAVAYFGYQAERKRREAIFAWAVSRGWRLETTPARALHEEFPGLKLFQKGHSRKGRLVIHGERDGLPVRCLDYKYVTGSGKNRTTHHHCVVILQCGFPTVPLLIRPENPFDKVGEFLGADDIDFESAEFSSRFFVKSNDRKWAYDVIHTRTMDFLLAAPGATVEFGMGEIAVYVGGRATAEKYEQGLATATGLYALIPDFVVRQMKGEGR
jgi:hypothetical protein